MPVHCPHSQHDMGVRIVSRRIGSWMAKCYNHAFGNKLLFTELPDKGGRTGKAVSLWGW